MLSRARLWSCRNGARSHLPKTQIPNRPRLCSSDGQTTLVGYVFAPHGKSGRAPAVVMMHGRAGAYSSEADGRYDASTLSKRHPFWGDFGPIQSYVALLVDGFRPPRYPARLSAVQLRSAS